jgi:3-dehydroquinate synthase
MGQLHIQVPAVEQKRYTIHIGNALLPSLLDQVATALPQARPFVITDQNLVEAGHLAALLGKCPVPHYVINPPGEISKHVNTVIAILEAMEKAYLGRDSVVIALGGGTVGDIAGFVAASFKRGIPVVQVPTTSLAQADSSVGGKTGVDSSLSKNAFGAFWHPTVVYMDVSTLNTLNDRDYRAGLVESVKHAMIADERYFEFIESNVDALLQRDPAVLTSMAETNCRIKGHVVQIDPQERNMRRILNYGHTLGHAVESASGYGLLHGEAIGIGLLGAARIEIELGLGSLDRYQRIEALLKNLGIPVKIPGDLSEEKILDFIKRDKKAVDKWPKFVLISRFGQIHRDADQWAVDVDPSIVKNVIKTLLNSR